MSCCNGGLTFSIVPTVAVFGTLLLAFESEVIGADAVVVLTVAVGVAAGIIERAVEAGVVFEVTMLAVVFLFESAPT